MNSKGIFFLGGALFRSFECYRLLPYACDMGGAGQGAGAVGGGDIKFI